MERRAADPAPHAANTNGVLFWPVVVAVVLVDLLTKGVAAYALTPAGFPHAFAGEWLRFTLVYNPGAAFGLHFGAWSRGILLLLTGVVLRSVWRMYHATPDRDNGRVFALALLTAGATGNALTRVLSEDGVVDFLDVGIGAHRWPTFNVADVAVTLGAVLLFRRLWRDQSHTTASTAPTHCSTASEMTLGTAPAELA